jgi:hypothetical protein
MRSNERRRCAALRADGQPCGMAPLHDSEFCWAHDQRYSAEAAEARIAGGQVKKNQGSLRLIYDLHGLQQIPDIRDWLEFAMFEMLRLPNAVSRNSGIMRGTQIAAELHEKGELADRIEKLEAAVLQNQDRAESSFDAPEASSDFLADDASP